MKEWSEGEEKKEWNLEKKRREEKRISYGETGQDRDQGCLCFIEI